MIPVLIVCVGIGIWFAFSARRVNRRAWLWGIIGFFGPFEFWVHGVGLPEVVLHDYLHVDIPEWQGFFGFLIAWIVFVLGLRMLMMRKTNNNNPVLPTPPPT